MKNVHQPHTLLLGSRLNYSGGRWLESLGGEAGAGRTMPAVNVVN